MMIMKDGKIGPAEITVGLKGETKRKRTILLRQLRKLAKSDDTEGAHCDADGLLLDYIGDPDIAEAYGNIEKWYA